MHAVIETHAFRRACEGLGVSEDERLAITNMISQNPTVGDLIKGTGGARKVRYAARGKGKSGGYRVITFFAADDVPVFLLDVYSKGERINLTQGERNELREILGTLAEEWRQSVREKIIEIQARKS